MEQTLLWTPNVAYVTKICKPIVFYIKCSYFIEFIKLVSGKTRYNARLVEHLIAVFGTSSINSILQEHDGRL